MGTVSRDDAPDLGAADVSAFAYHFRARHFHEWRAFH